VQSLARQGHTADDVRAILTDRRAVVAWGVDLLDLNDALIRPLESNDRNLWMVSGGVTSVGAPSRG